MDNILTVNYTNFLSSITLSTIAKLHVKTPTMNQIILQPELDAIHNSRQREKKPVPCPQPTLYKEVLYFHQNNSY